ncbi:MAG TPA: DUF3598 family protein [Candidatus Sericytochromatia bacterium]
MRSQWDCLLQNIGEWQGSFTRFSPRGEQLEDTPTVVSFETLNDHKTMRQTIRRLPPNQPVDEKVLEYSSLGRNILFLENGAFSLGSIQWGPFSEFGAELGLIEGNRRLRLVQMFDRTSQFERLTLIRERLAGTDTPERPPLTVEQLLGEWHGEAVTVYPDFRTSDTYPTVLKIHQENSDRLVQQLTFGAANSVRTIASTAKIDGSILSFDQSASPTQVLLLPDGASSNCPLQIKPGHFFILEVGWLLQPNKRQRLVRTYNDKGEWINLTLVSEEKVVG